MEALAVLYRCLFLSRFELVFPHLLARFWPTNWLGRDTKCCFVVLWLSGRGERNRKMKQATFSYILLTVLVQVSIRAILGMFVFHSFYCFPEMLWRSSSVCKFTEIVCFCLFPFSSHWSPISPTDTLFFFVLEEIETVCRNRDYLATHKSGPV